jgi:hypothetical protein
MSLMNLKFQDVLCNFECIDVGPRHRWVDNVKLDITITVLDSIHRTIQQLHRR